MKSIIRVLFGQLGSEIDTVNLDRRLVMGAMIELFDDYLREKQFILAFDAAKFIDSPECFRKIYSVVAENPNCFLDFKIYLMKAGEMRFELYGFVQSVITREGSDLVSRQIVEICNYLHDGDLLLSAVEVAIKRYWRTIKQHRELLVSSPDTLCEPIEILKALNVAKTLGAHGADRVLERFGDDLFTDSGGYKLTKAREGFVQSKIVPFSIQAWNMAGTDRSLKKAARGYEYLQDCFNAAVCYSRLEDYRRVWRMIRRIARTGDLFTALHVRALFFQERSIDSAELTELFAITSSLAGAKVVDAVSTYLTSHDNNQPFPTRFTFWHYSERNHEWRDYLETICRMASSERESIAMELYATRHVEVITEINYALKKHLLVGYMLSALALEVELVCPSREREYEHAFDAAWRTFGYAVRDEGLSPFPRKLALIDDPDIRPVYGILQNFDSRLDSFRALDQDKRVHTIFSHEFFREHSPETMIVVRGIYKQITADIRELLTKLK